MLFILPHSSIDTKIYVSLSFYHRLSWTLRNHPGVMQAVNEDDLMFGTLDSWLLYKLNGGHRHVTEPSNAIATGR